MTTKFFHPKQHLGYSTKLSIAENVSRGHRCALERHEKEPYLVTAHELEALANVSEHIAPKSSRHFRAAADYAFTLHDTREKK